MKIAGVTFLIFGFLIGTSLLFDLGMGFNMSVAVKNTFNPFRVMDFIELFMFGVFILLFFIETVATFRKSRKKKQESRR